FRQPLAVGQRIMPRDVPYRVIGQALETVFIVGLMTARFHKSTKLRHRYRVASDVEPRQIHFMLRLFFLRGTSILRGITPHQKPPDRNFDKTQKIFVGQKPGISTKAWIAEASERIAGGGTLHGAETTGP